MKIGITIRFFMKIETVFITNNALIFKALMGLYKIFSVSMPVAMVKKKVYHLILPSFVAYANKAKHVPKNKYNKISNILMRIDLDFFVIDRVSEIRFTNTLHMPKNRPKRHEFSSDMSCAISIN